MTNLPHSLKEDSVGQARDMSFGQGMWPHWNHVQFPQDEVGLVDILKWLFKNKIIILATILITTSLALTYYVFAPRKYSANVSIIPISKNASGGGLMGMASQLGSSPLLGGSLGSLLGNDNSQEFVNIIKSTTLTENLIKKFNLMPVLFSDQWDPGKNVFFAKFPKGLFPIPVMEDGVKKFQKNIAKIKYDKKNEIIKIKLTLKDPQLAAEVANGMLVELQDFINNNSFTVEKRNRIFLEKQLLENRKKYLEVGKDLNQFYSNHQISSTIPRLKVDLGSHDNLPATFEEFRSALKGSQSYSDTNKSAPADSILSDVPGQVFLEYLTFQKNLIAQTHALLAQQYELSKIEEIKEDLAFQVIDYAKPSIRPSSPQLLIVLPIGIMGGVILGVVFGLFSDNLKKLRNND
jgi:uncharacterized protein involved in exopolysaccharide biosynthesis